jgi:metal-sulfur cluster biosynthetic enzyme
LLRRIASRLRAGRGGEGGGVSIVAPESVKRRIADAEAALRRVKVPGYDVDVISSGVVVKFRVSMDGERIIVFVDYSGSNPGCSFCRFLNDTLWKRILSGIREALEGAGFKEVYIIDWARGSPVVTL